MIRTAWVYLVGLVLTLYWSARILLCAAFFRGRLPLVAAAALRKWSGGILKAAGVEVVYENRDRLPREQGQVLVSNHESWFDVFALAATLPLDCRFVGKKELSRIWLFGPAWLAAGHYAIDRSDRQAAISALNQVGEGMRARGHTVVLFPEGTRSPDGRLGQFKKGAFVLAINAGVPVMPVAVLGSREVMPKGRWKVRAGVVTIRVGQPIVTEGMDVEDRSRLMELARGQIAGLKAGDLVEEDARSQTAKAAGGAGSERESPTNAATHAL